MNANLCINRMDRFRCVLTTLKDLITPEEAAFKPNDNDWSITEIISHMLDIEIQDMRKRLRLTIEDPQSDWPPIDPEGWVVARNYKDNNFNETINRLINERIDSIAFLRANVNADWSVTHTHPKLGPIAAGDILAAWCSHDSLHLRQITKRLYQITQQDAQPYNSQYAGQWKA